MGQIVEAFHDATTDHAAKHALEKAQQVLSGDDGLEIGAAARKHVEAVVLGPQLSDADCDRVVQCADTVRVGDRVTRSVLSGRPRYV